MTNHVTNGQRVTISNTTQKKHRNICESCQLQVTWKVKFKRQFCPSRPVPTTMTMATMMTMAIMRKLEVISYMSRLEVVHKEVGGYLSIAQIDNQESLIY